MLSAGLSLNIFQRSGIMLFLPIRECIKVLLAAEKKPDNVYVAPSLDVSWSPVNEALSEALGSPQGIIILRTYEGTPIHEKGLREGDVISHINGHAINGKSMIEKPDYWPQPVHFMHELRRSIDASIAFDVWSNRKDAPKSINIMLETSRLAFRGIIPHIDKTELKQYSTRGAIIVAPLRDNKRFGDTRVRPSERMHSRLAVLAVEAECPLGTNEKFEKQNIITHVNGTAVTTLDEYESAWGAAVKQKKPIMLVTDEELAFAIRCEDAQKAEAQMRKRLRLDADVSANESKEDEKEGGGEEETDGGEES